MEFVIGGVVGLIVGWIAWGRACATAKQEAEKLRQDNAELGQNDVDRSD